MGSFGGIESGIQAKATENINSHVVVKYLQMAAIRLMSVGDIFVRFYLNIQK